MTVQLSADERWKAIKENCWFAFGANMKDVIESQKWPVFAEADGIYLRDSEGKEYINGASGHCCVNLGHGNKKIIAAIEEQLETLEFTALGHNDTSIRLCQRIAEVTPGDLNRVYIGVTGSDANETALAIARAYFRKQGKFNSMIISHHQVYHGASTGTMGLTSTLHPAGALVAHGRELADTTHGICHVFPPLCDHCSYGLEYPSCDILCARVVENFVQAMGPDNVMAFMAAPMAITARGIFPPKEYWPIIREICDKHGILLIFDEVITGWGRTGELFGSTHYNVIPDIMTFGKGLSNGYIPTSATVVQDYIFDSLAGEILPYYGHTCSFHPVASACTLACIDFLMEQKLWENAAKVGTHIKTRLEAVAQESKILGSVRGAGLLIGLELVEDKKRKIPSPRLQQDFWNKCFEKGLFLHQNGIVPPLIITKDEADKVCDIAVEALKETEAAVSLQ